MLKFDKQEMNKRIKETKHPNWNKISFDYVLPGEEYVYSKSKGDKPRWFFELEKSGGVGSWIDRVNLVDTIQKEKDKEARTQEKLNIARKLVETLNTGQVSQPLQDFEKEVNPQELKVSPEIEEVSVSIPSEEEVKDFIKQNKGLVAEANKLLYNEKLGRSNINKYFIVKKLLDNPELEDVQGAFDELLREGFAFEEPVKQATKRIAGKKGKAKK